MTEAEQRAALDEWLCRENVERLRRQLAAARDEQRRGMLSSLLAEQEARLDRIASIRKRN
jgi:hypothetical protein